MQQRRNTYTSRRRNTNPNVFVLAVLVFFILGVMLLSVSLFSKPKAKPATTSPVTIDESTTIPENNVADLEANIPAEPTPEPLPAPGTLMDSGTNLNDNYYKKVNFTGKISDLTASSFVMGKEMPATNTQIGKDHPGALTINYSENTIIKTARLYYSDDRYEIYMGSISDLVISPDYLYEVILEDPNASELWAKEIIVSEFIF